MHAHNIVDGRLERTSSVDAIRAAHAADQTTWVELGERSPEAERVPTETFGVHPLVVEDILRESSVPKIEELTRGIVRYALHVPIVGGIRSRHCGTSPQATERAWQARIGRAASRAVTRRVRSGTVDACRR